MNKKRLIVFGIILGVVIVIYFPGLSKLQQLKEENRSLEKQIADLKKSNIEMQGEIDKLISDPVYVETIARDKLKKTKKGEIIYKTE